jgi:hypothetical protein
MNKYVINTSGLRLVGASDKEAPDPEQVAQAKVHLQQYWSPSKATIRGSYGLKHDVENTLGGYCSNGALIQAATDLGFRVEPDGSGINAKIYVKKNRDAWKAFLTKYPHGSRR